MTNVKVKNVPKLRLADLLKRRKSTLHKYMSELGILTYDALVNSCDRMGVASPTHEEYASLNMPIVSSPGDGVVVIDVVPEKKQKKPQVKKEPVVQPIETPIKEETKVEREEVQVAPQIQSDSSSKKHEN